MNLFLWVLGSLFLLDSVSYMLRFKLEEIYTQAGFFTLVVREVILFVGIFFVAASWKFTYPETIAAVAVLFDVLSALVIFVLINGYKKFRIVPDFVAAEVFSLLRILRIVCIAVYMMGWAVQSEILLPGI